MQIMADRKIAEIQTFMSGYTTNYRLSGEEMEDIDADEDILIADPYFASVLNEDREILVGSNIYKFTPDGTYFTDKENNIALYDYLEQQATSVVPRGRVSSNRRTPEFDPGIHEVAPSIFLFRPTLAGFRNSGGGSRGGSGRSNRGSSRPTRDEIRDNLRVCEYRPNILNRLFGPSETCTDHFESNRRVKIKTWAQNYFIFASTGVKIKSQRRRFRIWWASKIDELELGYSIASFKYTGIGSWPSSGSSNPVNFHYELNGYTIDQHGRYVRGTTPARNLFNNFPLPNDRQLVKIWVYKPIQAVIKSLTGRNVTHLEYSGAKFNKAIRKLVENAVKELRKKGRNINGQPEAVVIFDDPEWDAMNFVYTNWKSVKTNENKISKIFDWSTAQIGIKTKGPKTKLAYSLPKKPENFNIVCYGMGRRGSAWRGGRIVITN